MRKPSRRSARFLVAAVATPALLVAIAQPASAVEVTPIAEAVDTTVASVDELLLNVATALFG